MKNPFDLKSSYTQLNLKKKKKCMELEFHTYSGVQKDLLWRFHEIFFISLIILGLGSLIATF